MSDLFETIKGGQDVFQKLLSYIPGFSGYIERSQRRAADQLLRDQVALRYGELLKRIPGLKKDLVDAGQFDALEEIDSLSLKLTTLADRIKNASYGYSGFFDAVKINEKELAQLYTFDAAFFTLAEQIGNGLDHVASAIGSEGLKSALRAVNDLALEAGQLFDKRYQVITGSAAPQQ